MPRSKIIAYCKETQGRLSEIHRSIAKLPDAVNGASELKKKVELVRHLFSTLKGDLERLLEREKTNEPDPQDDPLDYD